MTWDYAESNVFANSSGNILRMCELVAEVIEAQCLNSVRQGHADQRDAAQPSGSKAVVISTDPPYYDNIGYADLSDFFYVWLRRSIGQSIPDLFSTVATPKDQELIASPIRHGGRHQAESFFLGGMTAAMHRQTQNTHPAFPATIYYAFKQSESESEGGTSSTGWETFLDAVIRAGFGITGTWPVRTDRSGGFRNKDRNSLASSIVIVCRSRSTNLEPITRRAFISALRVELPTALQLLQHANIAPVDLAQAAIGPGMAIYTRYSRVVNPEGNSMSVREALELINQTLDEVLAEQEGDFDADTRWALAWFEQSGFANGEYGVAETLSKAKNTSVSGLVHAGILQSKAGQVRLLRPDELSPDWDTQSDGRLTVWEVVHHLVRRLEKDGEAGAAELVAALGGMAETARELAYRLYTICERKKRAQEALSYNALVQSWPEIVRLAREGARVQPQQAAMFT
jgi:putative DNA methylase